MFSCCCANKKALKKEQQRAAGDGEAKAVHDRGCEKDDSNQHTNNSAIKSPQKPASTDVASCKSPTLNDKSNSSDEDNNLSGLIMSDGLVGERR